jgi:hypothetical protein
MPDISVAIASTQKYQADHAALEASMPVDFDAQVVSLRNSYLAELASEGFASPEDALSAIAAVYPPSCGTCYQCCADYWSDCPSWNGTACTSGKSPMDCMGLCQKCQMAIEQNWPGASNGE